MRKLREALQQRQPTISFSPLGDEQPLGTEHPEHQGTTEPGRHGQEEDEEPEEPGCEGKTWRTDKYGRPLNPTALYMRFYRRIRSTKNPVPPEIAEKRAEADMEQHGKSKMHELYLGWLSCKGSWEKCALAIRVSKKNFSDHEDLFEFLLKTDLVKHLGDEALANDLVDRHVEAEKKLPPRSKGRFIKVNPDFPQRQELWRYKCWVGAKESKKQRHESEATLSRTAEVEEDSFYDTMDNVMKDDGFDAPAAPNMRPPPPPKPDKTKKEKTVKQQLEAAVGAANKCLTDGQLVAAKLKAAGEATVSTGYKAALSADLASHTKRLEDAKNQGVRILASQEGFQTGLVDLNNALTTFRKVSSTVNGHLKPKAKAKAKSGSKAAKSAAP